MNDLISIVIPCYQAEKHIEKCIASIDDQSYKNIEAIFIDDGSSDRTLELLLQIKDKHKNVVVLHEENSGVSAARNFGLKAASGRYTTFLDVDDTLQSDFCEKLITAMQDNNVDLVSSKLTALQYEDEFSNDINNHVYNKNKLKLDFEVLYKNWFFHNACGKLYITKYAKLCQFPKGVRVGEDLLFNLQYFRLISRCALINYYGYDYEANLSSAVHRYYQSDFTTQKSLYSNSIAFYEDYFACSYSGKAIDSVFVNNIIDIVNVCMTWADKEELIGAMRIINADHEIVEKLRTVKANGSIRRIIQYLIMRNSINSLFFLGRLNARRHR